MEEWKVDKAGLVTVTLPRRPNPEQIGVIGHDRELFLSWEKCFANTLLVAMGHLTIAEARRVLKRVSDEVERESSTATVNPHAPKPLATLDNP